MPPETMILKEKSAVLLHSMNSFLDITLCLLRCPQHTLLPGFCTIPTGYH